MHAPKLNLEVASILCKSAKNQNNGTEIAGLVNLTKDLIRSQAVNELDGLKMVSESANYFLIYITKRRSREMHFCLARP